MAYIPDEVILRQYYELTPAPIVLYAYYCARRNKRTGGWYCPKEKMLADIRGLTEPTYFCARRELITKKWIVAEKDFISPLVGFETIKNDSETIKNESHTLKNESRIYKDNTSSITCPLNQVGSNRRIGKNSGQPFNRLTKRSFNSGADAVLEDWLDQVAIATGAASRHTMADFDKWEQVCIKAIESGKSLRKLIELTKSEITRLADQPQFFSPNNILKQLQLASAAVLSPPVQPTSRTDEEKRADFEKQNYSGRRMPVIKL
jgi:hypothetical protein